jgi:hypothetical protein
VIIPNKESFLFSYMIRKPFAYIGIIKGFIILTSIGSGSHTALVAPPHNTINNGPAQLIAGCVSLRCTTGAAIGSNVE